NPEWTQIWKICRESARITIKDHPVDCCGREQALWLTDLPVHCRAIAACFGDLRPIEKAVTQVFRGIDKNGIIAVPGPAVMGYDGNGKETPWAASALNLSVLLKAIYDYSGSKGHLEKMFPSLVKIYERLSCYENGEGLIETKYAGLPDLGVFCGWD